MRWEYLRLQVSTQSIKDTDAQLDELGRQGWELVSTVEAAQSYIHMWFKRLRK